MKPSKGRRKPKTIELKDEIYGGRIKVIIGTWAEFVAEHKKRWKGNGEPLKVYGDAQEKMIGGYHCEMFGLLKGSDPTADTMIWVNGDLDRVNLLVCLSHELLHAALSLMDIIGVDIHEKSGNQETITYWHTWALKRCLTAMRLEL